MKGEDKMAVKGMSVFTHQGEDYTINDPNNAQEFDATMANTTGEYVYYQGDLYRFNSPSSANTAWGSRSKTKVKIGEEIFAEKTGRIETERQEINILANRAWDDTKTTPTPVTASGYYGSEHVITYYADAIFSTNVIPTISISFICYDKNCEKISVVQDYNSIPSNTKYFVFYARHDSLTKATYVRFVPASYMDEMSSFCEDIEIVSGAWDNSTTNPTPVLASGYYRCNSVMKYYPDAMLTTNANPTVIVYYICYDEDREKTTVVQSYDKIPEDTKYFVFYAHHESLTKAVYTKGSANYNVLNAADVGFLPSNSADDNTAAFQNAVFGGKRTIIVSQPGTYDLNDTILLDDDTEIIFYKGVIINKSADYRYVFINRGAYTRRYNMNITIRGLRLIGLDHESYDLEDDTSLFGMRGHISFLCTHNVKIYDYKSENSGYTQYVIQFNLSDNFIVDGADIAGNKDGIHISSSHKFVIRNCSFKTADDFIALNASDWASSNCVDGDVYDVTIENIIVREGTNGFLRCLVGAWVDWYSGIKVRRSELVMNNGNLYRVYALPGDVEYTSGTEPTNTDYNSTQQDSGGFVWLLMEKNVSGKYSTNIWNVSIKNIVNYCLRQTILLQTFRRDNSYARTLSKDVQTDELPKIEIDIEDMATPGGVIPFGSTDMDYVNLKMTINRIRDIAHELGIPTESVSDDVSKWVSIRNADFTNNTDQYDIVTGAGSTVYLNDCIFDTSIKGNIGGRLVSNCVMSSTPAQGVEGDLIQTESGLYVRKNNEWVEM